MSRPCLEISASTTGFSKQRPLSLLWLVLRQLIREDQAAQRLVNIDSGFSVRSLATPEQMKAGVILVTTLPILVVYPFLQKYFVKG